MILAKYIRLSSADEIMRYGDKNESCSITHQRMLLDRYISEQAEFDGCGVIEFSDDGRSGTNFDRPGVKALLEAAKRHQIDCVIVKDLSRFGRSSLEVCDYIERVFPFLGIRFISINDGYDSKDYPYGTAGDLGSGLRNLINEMYSRDLSQKAKAAKRQYAQRGQCIHGFPIYGYIKSPEDRRSWIPDPEAAPIVRLAFQCFLNGMRVTEIAKKLNAEHIPSPRQRKCALGYSPKMWKETGAWTDGAISRMLRDERYTGKLIALKTTSAELGSGGPSKKVPKGNWVVVPNAFEAIISQRTYDEAQKRIQSQTQPQKNPVSQMTRLFYRKLRCAGCGKCLSRTGNKKGKYYFCASKAWDKTDDCRGWRIYENELNQAVLESIHALAALAQNVEREFERQGAVQHRAQAAARTRRRHIQAKLKRMADQKREVYLKYDRGAMKWDEFNSRCGELTRQAKDLQETLSDTGNAIPSARPAPPLLFRTQPNDLGALEQLQALDRDIIDKLIQDVKAYPGKRIEISWNFSEDFMKLLVEGAP